MYRLIEATLVYINQDKDENYNPVITTKERLVKATLSNSFSVNYYVNQSRDMRRSRNIIVPLNYTDDLIEDSKRYQLEYAKLGAVKYKVKNVLLNRNSSLTRILDIEEVINE